MPSQFSKENRPCLKEVYVDEGSAPVCCVYSELRTITREHTEQAIDAKVSGVIDEEQQLPVRPVPALCWPNVNEPPSHYCFLAYTCVSYFFRVHSHPEVQFRQTVVIYVRLLMALFYKELQIAGTKLSVDALQEVGDTLRG